MSSDGLIERVLLTVVTVIQACVAAALTFSDVLPQPWKVLLVVASAGLVVLANQVPSWQSAPSAARAARLAKNPNQL